MPTVIWTDIALADTEGLIGVLAEVNPDAADRAAQAIRRAGDSLVNRPT
jgi:plasmid stabilization system protein ParE